MIWGPSRLGCLVLSREGGMDYGDFYWGLCRDYHRDPLPHSLLSTSQFRVSTRHGWLSATPFASKNTAQGVAGEFHANVGA